MQHTLRAPAKINLYLRVFPRARDGFHPLRSWFRTIELYDRLVIQPLPQEPVSPAPGHKNLELHCNDPALGTDSDNLIVRAWTTMSALAGESETARIDLDKQIPLGAGLGGGSSDAAATIAAFLWLRDQRKLVPPTGDELRTAGEALGSDVPFLLHHQLDHVTDATCGGRGEIVQPFTPGRRHVVLLMLPELRVSTAEVYGRFDELPSPPEADSPDFAAWSHLPAAELLPRLRNDLEAATFFLHPDLASLRQRAETILGRPVRMTGSGSGLFSLYDDRDQAAEAMERLAPLNLRRLLA